MGIWKEINENKIYKKGRFVTYNNGYKADRYLFRGALILMFIFLLYVGYSMDFDISPKVYFNCMDMASCDNPFYIDQDCKEGWECPNGYIPLKQREKCNYLWCEKQYLLPGEYGEKPTPLYKSFITFDFLILLAVVVINHLLYNRNFKGWECEREFKEDMERQRNG